MPRLPSLADLDACVNRNWLESVSIATNLLFFKRPTRVPGAYWQWFQGCTPRVVLGFRVWATLLTVCSLYIIAYALLFLLGSRALKPYDWAALICYAVYWLPPTLLARRAKLTFARYILEHNGMICFECGYDLKDLPDEYRCPECGTPYSKADLHRRWLEWMAKRTLRDGPCLLRGAGVSKP